MGAGTLAERKVQRAESDTNSEGGTIATSMSVDGPWHTGGQTKHREPRM